MKNGGVWRRLAGSLLGTRQIYLCGAVRYNYNHYYYEVTDGDARFAHDEVSAYYADGTTGPVKTEYGICGLYGKTPAESIPMLMDMITKIKQKDNLTEKDVVLEWRLIKRKLAM